MSEVHDLAISLTKALDDLEPMQHVIGQAGKKAAHEVLERSLGDDRAFSGLRRRVRLSAGYDVGQPVVLNLRPKGLIILADQGRKRTKRIAPRKRGGKRAVVVNGQPRAWSMSNPSKGKKVIKQTINKARADIPKALSKEISGFITKQL